MAENWVKVGTKADVAPGSVKAVDVAGQEVALYNVDGTFYATSNLCPHQGAPLSDGMLEGKQIICSWHAWAFDVETGISPVNPRAKIPCFQIKAEGEDIFVSL